MTHFKTLEKLILDNELELPKQRSAKVYEDLLTSKNIPFPDPEGDETEERQFDVEELKEKFDDVTTVFSQAARGNRVGDGKGNYKFVVDEVVKRRAYKKLKDLELRIRDKANEEWLIKMLRFQKSRGVISVKDEYYLYKYDSDNATMECECYGMIAASGFHVEVGGIYKYTKMFDENRKCDMFTVYATRVIGPDAQLNAKASRRLDKGFEVKEEDYEKEYTQYRGYMLRESEWMKYFREA